MTAIAVLIGVCIGGIAVLAIGCCMVAGQADRRENRPFDVQDDQLDFLERAMAEGDSWPEA